MSRPLLLLRPQSGNDATAERAKARGLDVIQLPLFEVVPAEAGPVPPHGFDAILLSSANGARFGREVLNAFAHLPVYAVGEATAQAARESGATIVRIGGGDAASTVMLMAAEGHDRVLHLCGADVRPFDPLGLSVTRHVVYRVVERDAELLRSRLDDLDGAVAAIHSPRAGRRLAALIPAGRRAAIAIAAISDSAALACDTGWRDLAVSSAPNDTALLACAEALCIRAG